MDTLTSRLLLYAEDEDSILARLSACFALWREGQTPKAALIRAVYDQVRRLVELAAEYDLAGDVWQAYLTWLLMTDENAFTLLSERTGAAEGTVRRFAQADLGLFRALFHYDFSAMEADLGIDCFSLLRRYAPAGTSPRRCDRQVGEQICALSAQLAQAGDDDAFFALAAAYYAACGVGRLGLSRVFRLRVRDDRPALLPVRNADTVLLRDLVGYEAQKRQLRDNTEAFLCGRPANHVLLYGDAGTGKSTSIRALANEYHDRGLRIIELYKHQLQSLPAVMAMVKDRNYRFILFLDDLSFEEDEVEYKFLKAVIEGGVGAMPDNVLLYASSNRRHLVRETWGDRSDMEQAGDIHRSDTQEEKLSLSARFGVRIFYGSLSFAQFRQTVLELAHRQGVTLPDETLLARANQWELRHSGRSGRTAQQFINAVLGAEETEE